MLSSKCHLSLLFVLNICYFVIDDSINGSDSIKIVSN